MIKCRWEATVSYTSGIMELVRRLPQLNFEDRLMINFAKQFMEAAFEMFSVKNGPALNRGGKGREEDDTDKKSDEKVADKTVVNNISFQMHPGVVTGGLGSNGAGKSYAMLDNPLKKMGAISLSYDIRNENRTISMTTIDIKRDKKLY